MGPCSATVPPGTALGGWALGRLLIATSDYDEQQGCGSLNAGQQEEVEVHSVFVDVPWRKEGLAFGSGWGCPGAGS